MRRLDVIFFLLSIMIFQKLQAQISIPQPTFVSTALTGTPYTVSQLVDLNSDGLKDMVVITQSVNAFAVYLATGPGTFSTPTINGVGDPPVNFALADYTGDGILDLAIPTNPGSFGYRICLWKGNGNGSFTSQSCYTTGIPSGCTIRRAVVDDMDNDGIMDFVVIADYRIAFIKGNNTGYPTSTPVVYNPGGAITFLPASRSKIIYDLDADGNKDIIVAYGQSLRAYKGNGAGGWSTYQQLLIASSPTLGTLQDYVVDDLDNDSKMEVGVEYIVNTNFYYLRIAECKTSWPYIMDTTQVAMKTYSLSNVAGNMFSIDMNNDNAKDIVTMGGELSILMNSSSSPGVFKSLQDTTWSTPLYGFVVSTVGDVNNDGKIDVVNFGRRLYVNPGNYYEVLLNNGMNHFNTCYGFNTSPAGLSPMNLFNPTLKDFEGDGDLDLIMIGNNDSIRLFRNPGNGYFTKIVSQITPNAGMHDIADFNNDNIQDIVIAPNGTLTTVYLGASAGTFAPVSTLSITQAGGLNTFINAGDFNNDGKADMVVTENISSSSNYKSELFLGNGNGTFAAPTLAATFTFGIGGWTTRTGDLNNDGLLDIVHRNTSGLVTLINTGSNTFTVGQSMSSAVMIGAAAGNYIELVDLNNDGKLDMVYYAGLVIHWALGNGNGTFGTVNTYNLIISGVYTTMIKGLKLADLNGDAFPDYIFACNGYEYGGYIINNGTGTPTTVNYFAPIWNGYGYMSVGDIDGNGSKDIVYVGGQNWGHSVLKNMSFPGSVSAASIFGTNFCAGQTSTVNSIIGGTFNAGNVFTAYLSDALGSFTAEVAIGSITSTTATSIPVTFPITANGTGYRIRVKSSNPISVSPNNGVNLTILPTPTVTALSSSTVLCSGSSATLTASGATTYSWNTGPTSSLIVVSPTVSTNYTVTGNNGSCSNTKTISLTVNALPSVTVTSNPVTICSGGTATMTATSGTAAISNYLWSTSATTSVITTNIPGVYSATITDVNGCVGNKSFTLATSSNLSLTATSNLPVFCMGNNATISVTGATSYTWSNNATGNSIVVSPTANTTYSVYGASSTCNGTTNILITVNSNPTVNASGSPTIVCPGSVVNLNSSGANTYTWSTGATSQNTTDIPSATTVYTVTGSNAVGCTDKKTVSVTVYPNPTVTATTNNSLLCTGQSSTLTANGANTYSWNPGGSGTSISVSPTVTTTYTVIGTDQNGCTNSAILTQSVSTCSGFSGAIVGNNGISIYPNPNDGELNVNLVSLDENTFVKIYDVLGKEVFVEKLNKNTSVLNLLNLPQGPYLLKIIQNNCTINQIKLIKQ